MNTAPGSIPFGISMPNVAAGKGKGDILVGSFDFPASTGAFTVSVGHQTKALLLIASSMTDADFGSDNSEIKNCFGAAASASSRWVIGGFYDDGVGTTDANRVVKTDKVISLIQETGTVLAEADIQSFDTNGFTIDVTTAPASTFKVQYISLSGDDLQAATGAFNSPTSTGDEVVSGVGFQPDCTILGSVQGTSTGISSSYGFVLGAASASDEEWGMHNTGADNSGSADTQRYQSTSRVVNLLSLSTGLIEQADLKSFDSDGFTLDYTTVAASAQQMVWIALKGLSFKADTYTTPASTGNNSVTGVGFSPSAVLICSIGSINDETVVASSKLIMGMRSSNKQQCYSNYSTDASSTQRSKERWFDDQTFDDFTVAGGDGSSTDLNRASHVSIDSDGFTENYSAVDGNEIVGFLAIG